MNNDKNYQVIHREITEITQRFKNFECVSCVEAIKTYLMIRGISGKVLKLLTGSSQGKFGNIYHEELGYNISTNGRHEAISVILDGVELIFDNLHPQGIAREVWLSKFYCLAIDLGSGFEIIEIDF